MDIKERIEKYLNEGTWAIPKTKQDAQKIKKLFEKKLTKEEAKEKLYDLIGDDEFYDDLDDAVRSTEDARQFIATWLSLNWLQNQQIKGKMSDDAIDIIKEVVNKWSR